MKFFLLIILFTVCTGCTSSYPSDITCQASHAGRSNTLKATPFLKPSPHFLVFLTDARRFDYSHCSMLLESIARNPRGDIGHAWVYLQGAVDEEIMIIEGGHSGELGVMQARYFDGIMNLLDYGYANPTEYEKKSPRYEPNPIRYLWEIQKDGFFQSGSGGHRPTCAAKIDITAEQFENILFYIENYPYQNYSLHKQQCSTFLAHIAALADFPLAHQITLKIPSALKFFGQNIRLWEDPRYAHFTFSTPDKIEESLWNAIRTGKAENALPWYLFKHVYGLGTSTRESEGLSTAIPIACIPLST